MRYAVISDIHGNLEAFEAVLGAIAKEKIDKYLSLGDVVGYGADPSACIKLLKSLDPETLIAGNHEWAFSEVSSSVISMKPPKQPSNGQERSLARRISNT